jgi:hypothetical protein
MKKILSSLVIGGFVLSFIATSCKKDTNNTPIDPLSQTPIHSTSLSGLGSHGGVPTGTAFVLPPNIKIVGSMTGGQPGFKVSKNIGNINSYLASTAKTDYQQHGLGTYVNVYFQLRNTANTEFKLVIPAGLIMCDSLPDDSIPDDTTQSGIIITDDTIVIPGDDTVGVCMSSFCLNLHHGVPSGNKYMFKVITNNDQLSQVVAILRTKKSLADHIGDIQSILWEITDGAGLTQADIDMMNSWQ